MHLSNENIQKIDNFLKAIGIELLDIRIEMVDHIATEIEENIDDINAFFEFDGFQTPFIKYMLSKKKSLLNKYQTQQRSLQWNNLKYIFKDILSILKQPYFSVLIVITFSIIHFFGNFYLKSFTLISYGFLLLCYLNLLFISFKFKHLKEFKLFQTYLLVSSMLIMFSVYLPINNNLLNLLFDSSYHIITVYSNFLFFFLTAASQFSLHKKRIILTNKFNSLLF
ncbi:hypothetical protein [Tenacibaculum geojense]|uniref:Uncharacterized protein n=1 Tax=Tenacibaculum geojense TaxID=915352 RepID=A0ABW3JQN5_9FLAO